MTFHILPSKILTRSGVATLSVIVLSLLLTAAPLRSLAQSQQPNDTQDNNSPNNPNPQDNQGTTQGTQDSQDNQPPQNTTGTIPLKQVARKQKPPPPPSNPLVKINPLDGSGNDLKEYNKDGTHKQPLQKPMKDLGDYKRNADDIRAVKRARNLPIFGYDYFAGARRLIRMREQQMRDLEELQSDRISRQYAQQRNRRTPQSNRSSGNGSQDRTRSSSGQNGTDTNIDDNPDANPDAIDNGNGSAPRRRSSRGDNSGDNNTDNSGEMSSDGMNDSSDNNSDNGDQSGSGTRSNRYNSNSSRYDTNSDNTDDTMNSDDQSSSGNDNSGTDTNDADAATRAENLRIRNINRAALGLAPIYDYSNSYDTSRQTNNQFNNQRNYRNGYDQNSLQDNNSNNSGNNQSDTNSKDKEPVNAYNDVADPLTQMRRNVTASAPLNYQLSGGDEVTVHYSNPSLGPQDVTDTVDQQGYLQIGKLTRVSVGGMTLADARRAVKAALSRLYKNVDVSISLKELRTITITVGGRVILPGSYTVPAVATVFNVLWAAGGPTRDGSLRNIEIRRGGRVISFDFYQVMAGAVPASKAGSANQSPNLQLQSGDVIYVPNFDQRVAVEGEVHNSALYELKSGETLRDALSYAGGIKASAASHRAELSTLDPGSAHVIKNVDLKDQSAASHILLYDGDVVDILALRPIVENRVTVTGAVNQPSDYALTPGMRVRDLIIAARNPLPEAFLGHAELYRWNDDGTVTAVPVDLMKAIDGDPQSNLQLMRWDRLEVYSRQESAFVGTGKLIVRGAIKKPGTYIYAHNMRVSDLLYKVGGPLPDAEMVVVEHQHGDGTFSYERVSVADLVHDNAEKDIVLQDNDIVGIYKNGETNFIPKHEVIIHGFVNSPGYYPRGENMKVSDLLQIAGGFLPDAGAKVVIAHSFQAGDRTTTTNTVAIVFDAHHQCAPQDDLTLQDGDTVLVQGKGEFEYKARVVFINGQVKFPGPIPIDKTTRLSQAIEKAGGLLPAAFPEGAQFYRDPKQMASTEQLQMARVISDLNDLNNQSAYKRELAKSDLERIKAAGAAQSDSSFGLGSSAQAANPASAALAIELSKHDLVSKPRVLNDQDLQPSGNLAVNLPAALSAPGGTEDVLLKDGDTITIPEIPTTVQVVGAIVNPRGVKYEAGNPLSYYLDQAGGLAPDAAKDMIVVIHAGGGLSPGNKIRALRPGDVIVVPTRVMAEKIAGRGNSLANFFQSFTTSAIVFRLATGAFGL